MATTTTRVLRALLVAVAVLVASLAVPTAPARADQTVAARTAVGAATGAFAAATGGRGTLSVVVTPLQERPSSFQRPLAPDRTPAWVGNDLADRRVLTASVVKLYVVADVLHRARTGALQLGPEDYRLLQSMIVSSNDGAMSTAWDRWDGEQAVRDTAARYGLTGTTGPAQAGQWGEAVTTAADVAQFLSALPVVAAAPDASTLLLWMAIAAPLGADGFDQSFGLLSPAVDSGVLTGPAAKQGWMCCVDGTRQLHSVGVVDGWVVVLLGEMPTWIGWNAGRAALDSAAVAMLTV